MPQQVYEFPVGILSAEEVQSEFSEGIKESFVRDRNSPLISQLF